MFDPATHVSHTQFGFTDAHSQVHMCVDEQRVHVYTLPELRRILPTTGLEVVRACGGVALPRLPVVSGCHTQLIVVGRRDGRSDQPG